MTQRSLTRPTESPFKWWDFFIVLAIMLAATFAGTIVAMIVFIAGGGEISLDPQAILTETPIVWVGLVFQWIGTAVGLVVVKAIRKASWEDFGFPITFADATGILWGLGALGGLFVFGALIQGIGVEAPNQDVTTALGGIDGPLMTVLAVLGIGVVGPLTEELTYRAVLQGGLTRRLAPWPSIIIASVIFAVMHFQLGAPLPIVFGVLIVPIFVLSLLLGWLVERDEGRIGRAFFAHAAFNSVQVLLLFSGLTQV